MAGVTWAAIVVAAGRGTRFGRPKQLLDLAGLPMVGWAIRTFAAMPEVAELIVVTEPDWAPAVRDVAARLAPARAVRVIDGGSSRQASVCNG
ncbi:MAG TPA: 2-C-methyl-D-erythritol 4-phosphate cytidylyltransferase, partial [Candidatus Tumulicola sp.]